MNSGKSRRAFLCALPLSLAAQVKQPLRRSKPLPAVGEFARVTDPVTENVIVRLTGLNSTSVLPYSRNHFVSARERVLIFASNRTGHFTPHQIDLHTGSIKQLAEAEKLNPKSLSFDHQEKLVRYLDGTSLYEVGLGKGGRRQIGVGISSFGSAADGALYVISEGKLMRTMGKELQPLAVSAEDLWPQPNSAGCLFARSMGQGEQEFYYAAADGAGKATLMASGRVRDPFWDADGQSILFLRDVTAPNGTILAEIHGRAVQTGDEYVVSGTSQFASFAPNSDASVFVGASRSRAQPNIVLMLRSPRREMTLCEHRSSHPGEVTPVFAPDNRRVYFESDHEGRSAIYSVNVELLVEPFSGG